jgi:hypothetical protein
VNWLKWAEVFDSWRVIPRLLLAFYCTWSVYLIDKIVNWYIHLSIPAQTVQNAALITAVSGVLTGFGVPIFNIYSQNGRDWNAKPN